MSQATTDAEASQDAMQAEACQDDMQEENAQRWPTPSDPCTQQSHASDSQTSKEDDLAAAELRLEQMGYRRPFPAPVPIEFEQMFPLPEDVLDWRAVGKEKQRLEDAKDRCWEAAQELRRRGLSSSPSMMEARFATREYVAYLEQIHSGAIKPVDGPSYRQEGNKLAAMRMYLLEALADEAIKRRPGFP